MKKIIIMGASSGIGLALAKTFASRGVTVGLAARNLQPLKDLHDAYPDNVKLAKIDICNDGAGTLLQNLIDDLGGMDIYLHVAGIGYDNPDFDPEREARMLNTNVVGFARMISTAYNYFRTTGRHGQIAAITSVAGTKGTGCIAAYSASKSCDQTYLSALRQLAHIQDVNVDITDIRPGWIKTPLLKPGYHYPLTIDMDTVIVQILRALVDKKRTCTIDWRWRLLTTAWRYIPNYLWEKIPLRSVELKD